MNDKQLYEKLGQNNYDKVFPITYLENIIEKDTDNNLTVVLSRFNHIWIPYQGDRINTRKAVPTIYRRNSLTISYYNVHDNHSVTEMFTGTDIEASSDAKWILDSNWCRVLNEKYLEEIGAKIPIADNTIDYDMLNNELKQMFSENGGTVINYPDEEDITLTSSTGCCAIDRLKLKDRKYEPAYKTGKGYKILRKNLIPVEESFTGDSYNFNGILDETYCEQNGAINIINEIYDVKHNDIDRINYGIFYDKTHHMFILRVLLKDDVLPYYNYYARWNILESKDSDIYKSNEYYNVWNNCLEDEYPRLNTIFIYNNDKYQYINKELIIPTNEMYVNYKSVLKQDMINEENTRYIIRYDFDLDKKSITIPKGCELVFEGGIIQNGTLNLNGCKLTNMVGLETDYLINCSINGYAIGQIEYRDAKICYWNGTEWRTLGDVSSFSGYSKEEIDNKFTNYYTKSQTYNKTEIDNKFKNITDNYVTKNEFNEFKTSIGDTITSSVNLDKIQEAINKGCNVTMAMPSINSNKISLPIWTGTSTEYAAITHVAGVTYNITD